jgi:hypothetical protein
MTTRRFTFNALPALPPAARIIILNVLVWVAICAIGASGLLHNDDLQSISSGFPKRWAKWCLEYVPALGALSSSMSLAMMRWPALFERPRYIAAAFFAVVFVFKPMQWAYLTWLRHYDYGAGLEGMWQTMMGMRRFGWFETAGTFAAMVAIGNWRQSKARQRAWQRSQTDNLNLRLALEQQRMLALRAQLEPHFMFNALNAISALVRNDDKAHALTGINRLSDLLRYALSATARESVSVAEELQFVRDYLDLQRMRYGERLQVQIKGEDQNLHKVDCPPLLLQPLIENALRHDLDCHDGPSDIRVSLELCAGQLLVLVSNPVNADAPRNPGAGLGLQNTRERLRLMHPSASLESGVREDAFVAEIRLPLANQR